MTRSKPLKPFMAYLDEKQYARMKKFSVRVRIPMSHLIREAIDLRISEGNQYVNGFNAGIEKAMHVVSANKASEMRFPSGRSFAELINTDLVQEKMIEGDKESAGQP